MLLRHATLIRNLPGIERRGLLCCKSQGRLPVVWLHTPAKSFWATRHRPGPDQAGQGEQLHLALEHHPTR
jgi:hypothetical protein